MTPLARIRRLGSIGGVALACATAPAAPTDATPAIRVDAPRVALDSIPFDVTLTALDAAGHVDVAFAGDVTLSSGARATFAPADRGSVVLRGVVLDGSGRRELTATGGARRGAAFVRVLPGAASIVPPLLAILAAIVFRQVLVALTIGLFAGALFLFDFHPLSALLGLVDSLVVDALADRGHVQILVYSMILGGMIGVIQRSGGTLGIVDALARRARTARSAQLATGALSTAIFFDDWASCLIVGPTMRPLTDRMRVSREKLAFLVHSLAVCFATFVPFSTWVGTQVGLIQGALAAIDPPIAADPFTTLVRSMSLAFYPVVVITLVFSTAGLARERGSMLAAERRARTTGKLLRDGASPLMSAEPADERDAVRRADVPHRAVNALLPIAVLIVTTLAGLWITGVRAGADLSGDLSTRIRAVLERGDSNVALLWASTLGILVAIGLAVFGHALTLRGAVDAACDGARSMTVGILILVLAWVMANVSSELHAKDWLAHALLGKIAPQWFPCLVFGAGMAISFSIGTAWGTMGILMPLTVPTAVILARAASLEASQVQTILLATTAATLGGSVFGNHASPLGDTAVLASLSTASDLFDHLRTQLPYALLAAGLAAALGFAPVALGLSPPIALLLCIGAAIAIVRFGFTRVDGIRAAG